MFYLADGLYTQVVGKAGFIVVNCSQHMLINLKMCSTKLVPKF